MLNFCDITSCEQVTWTYHRENAEDSVRLRLNNVSLMSDVSSAPAGGDVSSERRCDQARPMKRLLFVSHFWHKWRIQVLLCQRVFIFHYNFLQYRAAVYIFVLSLYFVISINLLSVFIKYVENVWPNHLNVKLFKDHFVMFNLFYCPRLYGHRKL